MAEKNAGEAASTTKHKKPSPWEIILRGLVFVKEILKWLKH